MSQFRYRAENVEFDFATNGEQRVLEVVAATLTQPGVLFDVGANQGEWSRIAASLMPAAAIHAFEVVPDTASVLAARVADLPQVHVNAYGLSAAEEPIVIYSHGDLTAVVE